MGTLILWTVLVFGIEPYLLPRASADAVVLFGSLGGVFGGFAACVVIFALGIVIGRLIPLDDGTGPLVMLSLALCGWAMTGGTIDAWLLSAHDQVGPATGAPFRGLLLDYLALGAIYGGLAYLSFPKPTGAADLAKGPLALLLMVVFGGALTYLLAGPEGHTYHGQVLFGVAVANWGAVHIVRNLTGIRDMRWYWPAPILVGIVAMLLCSVAPKPTGLLGNLNVVPPWAGLGRPLPIEYVGAGIASVLLSIRSRDRQEAGA